MLDLGLGGFSITDYLPDHEPVYIIDAAEMNARPGVIRMFDGEEFLRINVHASGSLHGFNICDIIKYSMIIKPGGNIMRILCVQPGSISPGGLSDGLESAFDSIAAHAVQIIKQDFGGYHG